MINNCKDLFQKAYCYNNVKTYLKKSLYTMNNLIPNYVGSRRLFITTCDSNLFTNMAMTSLSASKQTRPELFKDICDKLNPTDILLHLSVVNTDIVSFDIAKFLNAYDSLNKKVVFGGERNLWPSEASDLRHKLDNMAGNDTVFKYLNTGFVCCEAGEMAKILEEQIYECEKFGEQEYFLRVLAQEKYSMTLDYKNKLVYNTFRCTDEEIKSARAANVPFIHFNAGR